MQTLSLTEAEAKTALGMFARRYAALAVKLSGQDAKINRPYSYGIRPVERRKLLSKDSTEHALLGKIIERMTGQEPPRPTRKQFVVASLIPDYKGAEEYVHKYAREHCHEMVKQITSP